MLRRLLLAAVIVLLSTLVAPHETTGITGGFPNPSTLPLRHLALQTSGALVTRTAFALSVDGELGATAAGLWNIRTGQFLWNVTSPETHLPSVAFAPDGTTLAYGKANAVQIWDVRTGTLRLTLDGSTPVSFSPDGRLLASGGADDAIRLWDAHAGGLVRTLARQERMVWSLAFVPDGLTLVSIRSDAVVRLWDVRTGEMTPLRVGNGRTTAASISLSEDGKILAMTGSVDKEPSHRIPMYQGEVQLWEIQTGKLLRTLPGPVDGSVGAISFAHLGMTLASGNSDGTVQLWDASTGKLLRTLKGEKQNVEALAFSFAATMLYVYKGPGRLEVWHVPTGQLLRTLAL
jgi:WD40 repeat protein